VYLDDQEADFNTFISGLLAWDFHLGIQKQDRTSLVIEHV
jgi:hypothetical protein